jgi:molybdopterin/thiamine biosynthesis adenylyltransferase
VSRQRWWERAPKTLEEETAALAEVGFSLEREILDETGDVVFVGELRYGDRRHPARVILPPAFDRGAQAHVVAPGLPIGRHISPGGDLCLDHPISGEKRFLDGATAVALANDLWRLWSEDRPELARREARVPDPRSNYMPYETGSAIVLADADVSGGHAGVIRVGLSSLTPLRGALTGLGITDPDTRELEVSAANHPFTGNLRACGLWRRLDAPPPGYGVGALRAWVERSHADLLEQATTFASFEQQRLRVPAPALIGFVYPDEVRWGEQGDQWLLLFFDAGGNPHAARAVPLQRDGRFTRQPLLEPLTGKSVAVIGLGALGSTIASLLARAGVGRFVLMDRDYLAAGNVVRHDLDLRHVGITKAVAMQERLLNINSYVRVTPLGHSFGNTSQAVDDEVYEALATCDLIVNAAANSAGIHEHISAAGRESGRPVLHAWIGAGGWGARIIAQRESSGCVECLGHHQEGDPELYRIEEGPEEAVLDDCGSTTFTASGFDLTTAASAAARAVVGMLLDDSERYPAPPDMLMLTMRTAHTAVPTAREIGLPIHPRCSVCNA